MVGMRMMMMKYYGVVYKERYLPYLKYGKE